jgi:hypothetical protein
MKKFGALLLLTLLMSLCASCGNTPPPQSAPAASRSTQVAEQMRAVYEMREKCGYDARAWFDHQHTEDMNTVAGIIFNSEFRNHYNERLNRCYAVQTTTGLIAKDLTQTLDKHLFEVNENKDIGRFFTN